jgi:Carboxypeptidase regulatory-like domain
VLFVKVSPRRKLVAVAVVAALGLVAGGLALREASPGPTASALPVSELDFQPVAVRAEGSQPALALSGVVKDPSGAPVANAQVSLAASGQQALTQARCAVCGEPLLSCRAPETARTIHALLEAHRGELGAALTTTTDAAGRFKFEGLSGISFTVWASATGLGDAVHERAAPGDPVELFLPAARGLHGVLRDEAGQPIAGTVRVVSRRLARVVEVAAGGDGAFAFSGLGEGPFFLQGSAPGRLPSSRSQVEAGGQEVSVVLPSPRRLEVRLLDGQTSVEGTVALQGDHLAREVPAPRGLGVVDGLYPGELVVHGVAGALASAPQRVTLVGPVTRLSLQLERAGRVLLTVVDEAGQPVPEPTVELLTRTGQPVAKKRLKTGELGVLGPVAQGEYQVRAIAEGHHPVTLPAQVRGGAELALELVLPRGTLISGRVIDEYGRAAPGVSVLVVPTGDSVLSDAEGKFRAAVPSPGLYTLQAHHSDWGGGEVKVSAPRSGVDLQLEAKGGAQITVTVDGRRVEGAHAMLYHQTGNYRSDRPSGADGVVLMRGLPPDTYLLVATHPDFLPSERQSITLQDGQMLQVAAALKPGAAITGQVVDTTGVPVPSVLVSVTPRGAEPATTDSQGSFRLSPLRPKATYALRVTQRGFEQADRTLATPGGEPVRLVVKRQPVFRGRVLGEGQALKSFRVDDFEVTAADGRFELPLPATEERVIVSVEAPGFEPQSVDRPNAPELGDFDLRRAPLVTGMVREEAGGPVDEAVVTCDACEQSVLSDADGRFSLGRPALQKEFKVIARKGRRAASQMVTDGATSGVELVLKPGVQLSGTAYLPDGHPAAGVEISGVQVDRSEPVSVVTGADGSYALEVTPGIWRFVLQTPGFHDTSGDPPAVILDVEGTQTSLDFGPTPGLASLTVRVAPQPGYALWLVQGELKAVGNPPMELLHAPWAQLVYQPRVERVSFGGLLPGRYTLVWASFHAGSPTGPTVVPVDVPSAGELTLVR